MQTIHFHITLEDIKKFSIHSFKEKFSFLYGLRRAVIVATISILIAIVYIGSFDASWVKTHWLEFLKDMSPFYCGIFIFFLLYPKINKYIFLQRLKNTFKKNPPLTALGDVEIILSPEGLSYKNPWIHIFTKWKTIRKIEQTHDYAFLHNGPHSAYIVPRRAFKDDQEFRSFIDLGERFLQSAKMKEKNQI